MLDTRSAFARRSPHPVRLVRVVCPVRRVPAGGRFGPRLARRPRASAVCALARARAQNLFFNSAYFPRFEPVEPFLPCQSWGLWFFAHAWGLLPSSK